MAMTFADRVPGAVHQLAHARHDLLRLERLHQHAITLHLLRAGIVHGLERPGKQQHGNVREIRPSL